MRIGKFQTTINHPVYIGRDDFGIGIISRHISYSQIIRQNVNDVGITWGLCIDLTGNQA
jgi:hypothetical protein